MEFLESFARKYGGGGSGGSGLALGETSSTAYRGDRGKIAYDHSQTIGNPHGTTKNDIGLGNVDNTSDLNKPISTATQQALNNKLDKGTYTGNASDLKDEIDNIENSKLDIPIALGHGVIGYWYNLYGNVNNFIGSELYQDVTGNIGVSKTNPTEKLDVNGNVKATQIKDQYGSLKSQRVITITGNITLSETHNGAILHVTNTCNITIPTGLDVNFQCVVYAKGSIIVTFVNGGVTINSPSGLLLKTDKMASLFASASNTFNLLGELATS